MRVDPREIVLCLKRNDGRIRQTARELGVSPGTIINWKRKSATGYLKRARRYSTIGLQRLSTKPKTIRSTTISSYDQVLILDLRKRLGCGAIKITSTLRLSYHYQTVHRFLGRRGLVATGPTYRRPRYQKTTHMYTKNAIIPGILQMDVKYVTPELSGLPHTCYLYAVMDIFSRYKQGLILPLLDQALAIETLTHLVPTLPFKPTFVQTDNGLEFQERFHTFVTEKLKLQHHYIHKSSPNENAVIERSFRTDEEEFFWRMDGIPMDVLDLNSKYQDFLRYYNEERLHLGIDLLTPLKKLQSVQ